MIVQFKVYKVYFAIFLMFSTVLKYIVLRHNTMAIVRDCRFPYIRIFNLIPLREIVIIPSNKFHPMVYDFNSCIRTH